MKNLRNKIGMPAIFFAKKKNEKFSHDMLGLKVYNTNNFAISEFKLKMIFFVFNQKSYESSNSYKTF